MFDLNHQLPNKQNHHFNHHAANYRNRFNGGSQFRLETMKEDSGVCSPPLWRNNNNNINISDHPQLSPSSRAQAIARGQREMMEMVENMPETSYELSLKDIVEQRRDFLDETPTLSMEEDEERSILQTQTQSSQRWKKNKKGSVKRQETGRIIIRNGSINHNKGLLINMFFPFSIGSKKKTTTSSFGPPKPHELVDKSVGGDRTDWWWKKFTGSGDSESLGITSSSGTGRSGSSGSSGSSAAASLRSNSASSKSNCSYGCWSFFSSRKRKS